MVVNMKNKIFFCFIILLTLFLSISVISASENMTCDNLTSVDGNEVLANETDLDNIEDVENKSSTDIVANDKVSYVDYNDEFGSVICAWGFDILCPSGQHLLFHLIRLSSIYLSIPSIVLYFRFSRPSMVCL